MKNTLLFCLIGISLAAVTYGLVTHDWKPWPPSRDYGHCLGGHEETTYVPQYTTVCNGNSCSTQFMYFLPVTSFVCDAHQYPLGDGPRYRAALPDYNRRLAEWQQRHPEKNQW